MGWFEPDNGGSNINDYQVLMCSDAGPDCSFELVASSTEGQTYHLATGLVKGYEYEFKVQAVNAIGVGAESDSLTVVAADKPN